MDFWKENIYCFTMYHFDDNYNKQGENEDILVVIPTM